MINTNTIKMQAIMKKLISRTWLAAVAMCIALMAVSCATPAIKKPNPSSNGTNTSTNSTSSSNKPKGSIEKGVPIVKMEKDTVN
jgi:hypothetical protein